MSSGCPDKLTRIRLVQSAILAGGFLLGMIAAYLVTGIRIDGSGDVLEARRLGIVSLTIQAGYSKSRDMITCLAVLGLPVMGACSAWALWVRGERFRLLSTGMTVPAADVIPPRALAAGLLPVAVAFLLFSYDSGQMVMINSSDFSGAWPFLGEEGANLAWVQSILSGGVFGRDFFCLYGPMLVYPQALFMKLFGETVLVSRYYTLLLNVIAYGVLIVVLAHAIRRSWLAAAALAALLTVYYPLAVLSPNTTYLRVALGILPLALICRHEQYGGRWTIPLAGLVLGQSMLFSQEVGICSFLASMLYLGLQAVDRKDRAGFVRESLCLTAGLIVSVTPLLVYLALKGASGPFLSTLYGYPKLVMLGYGSLPFPDFHSFVAAPFARGALLHYWVIIVYALAAAALFPRLLLGKLDSRMRLAVALLVFGALLFRAALGRSDEDHVFFASPPALLLLFLLIDGNLSLAGTDLSVPLRILRGVVVTGLAVLFLLPFAAGSTIFRQHLELAGNRAMELVRGTAPAGAIPAGPAFERAGVRFDQATLNSIEAIHQLLISATEPGEMVYFYPNEAAYYFLFNRKNPTRYAIAYFAATRSQRQELIADLERHKPRYVVFSMNTWRIDSIPEHVQIPEVVDYLQRSYRPYRNLGDVLVLRRVDG